MQFIIRLAFFTILITFSAACSARVGIPVGQIPPAKLPTTEEAQGAKGFISSHVKKNGYKTLAVTSAEHKRVAEITERLTKAANFPAKSIPVSVVDAKGEVNAMAVNSASIVVYKALLDKVSDNDELATVISHEVAHILGRHAHENEEKKENAKNVRTTSAILGSIASIATSAAGFGGLSGLAGDVTHDTSATIGYGAFVAAFDRDQEYEADHVGMMLMAKAGYDPNAAIRFWSKAKEIFGDNSSKAGRFFSTHPHSDNRTEALKDALPHAEKHRPVKLEVTSVSIKPSKKSVKVG